MLRRLVSLCKPCHTATHFGLATVTGVAERARAHLCQVTGMTAEAAAAHIDEAFRVWAERSAQKWTLDLTVLTAAGVHVQPPPRAAARARFAEDTWRSAAAE